MYLKTIQNCRICGNPNLTPVINLGKHFLHGNFCYPDQPSPPHRKIPTELVLCRTASKYNACGALQLQHEVPPEILYYGYGYHSSTSKTMTDWLKNVIDQTSEFIKLENKAILDCGANDCFLLKQLNNNNYKVAIDPSDIIDSVNDPNIEIIKDYFPSSNLYHILKNRKSINGEDNLFDYFFSNNYFFDCIFSLACFYDSPVPLRWAQEVGNLLHRNGLWVFEVAYLPSMIENLEYGQFCHEHLLHYSLASIEYILKESSLKLVKAVKTQTNGGSILCFATPKTNDSFDSKNNLLNLRDLRFKEFDSKLDEVSTYRHFYQRISQHGKLLFETVYNLKQSGKKIALLGASTKGNLFLNYSGLSWPLIDHAADRSPKKWGAKTLGTNIPIVSEEESRKLKPDYYLCFIGHFKNEILEREKQFIENGGKIIFAASNITIYPS